MFSFNYVLVGLSRDNQSKHVLMTVIFNMKMMKIIAVVF